MNEMEQMLILRCKNGDINAFEILVSEYDKKIYNIAYGLVGNAEDAKDITQDAFLKAFKNIKNFRGDSSFSTWIHRIAINAGKDFIRKSKKSLSLEEIKSDRDIKDESAGPQDYIERKEKSLEINEALIQLKEEHRNVILLKDVQGFSYQEIADILEINIGTVKSRISRGRYLLRDLLKKNKELNMDKL